MAQYDDPNLSREAFKDLLTSDDISPETKRAIEQLVNDSAASFAVLAPGETSGAQNADAVATEQNTNLGNNAQFDNATAAVFEDGTSGTANFNVQQPVTMDLIGANELEVNVNNDANNSITVNSGESTVNTGDGQDIFMLKNDVKGKFNSGRGDDEFKLDESAQENVDISVDAGDGFDLMTLFGQAIHHSFSFTGGKFHMQSGIVELKGIEVIVTDQNGDGVTADDHLTILAPTKEDSLVARLYKVALGREPIDGGDDPWKPGDPLAGIDYWMNEFEKYDPDPHNVKLLAYKFMDCPEFHNDYDKMKNDKYVDTIFNNLTDGAELSDHLSELKTKFLDQLNNNEINRYDVAYKLAIDSETIKLLGDQGIQYVIDGVEDRDDFFN